MYDINLLVCDAILAQEYIVHNFFFCCGKSPSETCVLELPMAACLLLSGGIRREDSGEALGCRVVVDFDLFDIKGQVALTR